jgi:hypothetical protein
MLDTPPSDEANPLAYGSAIPIGQLLTPVMIGGGIGYSMTNTNGFISYLYPARTTDGGKSWEINGVWFANPTADSGNFVDTIGGASSQVAWAWSSRPTDPSQTLFTTIDGGQQWYRTVWPGIVKSIGQGSNGDLVARVAPLIFEVNHKVVASGSPGVYTSTDGGGSWEFVRAAR